MGRKFCRTFNAPLMYSMILGTLSPPPSSSTSSTSVSPKFAFVSAFAIVPKILGSASGRRASNSSRVRLVYGLESAGTSRAIPSARLSMVTWTNLLALSFSLHHSAFSRRRR